MRACGPAGWRPPTLSPGARDRPMLQLPGVIQVQLVDSASAPLSVEDVLVGLNILLGGRYYYGNLVGLTDASGRATITGEELERRFKSDRVAFPADYKVELRDCDAEVELFLLTSQKLSDAQAAVSENYSVPPSIKEAYRRARNAMVHSALTKVDLSMRDERPLLVNLATGVRTT